MNATPPRVAMNRYLKDKVSDMTDSTLSNYQTTLRKFVGWLEDEGITILQDLTSDDIL